MTRTQKCFCCGKEYEVCPHCPTDYGFSPWRSMHCSIDHFKIFEIVREYQNGALTRDEALDRLSRTDTTGYETFDTATGEILRRLLTVVPVESVDPVVIVDERGETNQTEIAPVPNAKAESNVARAKRSKRIQ